MWSAIRWLVLRIAAIRWLFKLGWLGTLLPIALLLKTIGLPLLAILAVVGLPILALLFLFGLPIFLVVIAGGLLLGFVSLVLTIGVAAIKFAIFVVLPIWLIWRLARGAYCWMTKRGDNGGSSDGPANGGTTSTTTSTTTSSDTPTTETFTETTDTTSGPVGDPLDGVNPA